MTTSLIGKTSKGAGRKETPSLVGKAEEGGRRREGGRYLLHWLKKDL